MTLEYCHAEPLANLCDEQVMNYVSMHGWHRTAPGLRMWSGEAR